MSRNFYITLAVIAGLSYWYYGWGIEFLGGCVVFGILLWLCWPKKKKDEK